MRTLAFLLLIFIFLKCLLFYKTSRAITLRELRRQARTDSKKAQALYKLLAYQQSFNIVILLLGAISGTLLLLIAANISGWLVGGLLLAITWLLLDDRFNVKPDSRLWGISCSIAPIALPVVDFLHPGLAKVSDIIGSSQLHNKIYEREDLLELLSRQKSQIDNRISETELKAARGALTFGDKLVSSIMTPRKAVEWVNKDAPIAPKLMDDLHKTGFIRFPVISGSSKPADPEVVGTLYLTDLLKNLEKPGKIADIMKRDACFINESHNLKQALDGFLKSGQHLSIVVNNFEETVGVLTLEDVLSQILGQKISDEFDRYHDKRSVAAHQPKT